MNLSQHIKPESKLFTQQNRPSTTQSHEHTTETWRIRYTSKNKVQAIHSGKQDATSITSTSKDGGERIQLITTPR